MVEPAGQVLGNGDAAGVYIGPSPALYDEARALNLSLPLGASERMPLAPALTGGRVSVVNNDGPAAGRPLANVPLHLDFSSAGRLRFDLSNIILASSWPRPLGCSSTLLKSLITGNPEVPAIIRCAAVRTASAFS